jgi:excisionase family DNA binding protein
MAPTIAPREYAQRLGVAENKVLTWIRSGELKALNVATKATGRPRWRLSEEAIREFEEGRTARPHGKPRETRPPYERIV